MSFLDDAISNLGQTLAQTAVATANKETGYNVGGALNALFGTGQTTGAAPFSVPFMSDNILGYELTISPSSPFDFMNFAAYNTPLPNINFVV